MFSKLSDHDFKKGVFRTKFSQSVTPLDKESDWIHSKGPEYLWIGLALQYGNRTEQMERMMLALTNLSKELDLEKILPLPAMSLILNLGIDEKKILIESLNSAFDLSIFSPLSIILPDSEEVLSKSFYNREDSFHQRLDVLAKVLNEITDQHSQLSTDVRYLLLYYKMLQGKINFVGSQSHTVDELIKYPYLDVSDPEMRIIRPMIRSMELGLSMSENMNYPYSKIFWKNISQLTDCEVYSIIFDKSHSIDLEEIKVTISSALNYYRDLLKSLELFNEKLYVLTSILTYSYKRLLEIINHDLQYTISGRSIVRSCIENYVMTKYLIAEEENHKNIWEEYQYYGIGGYKLVSERYIENQPELTNPHINFEYLNLLVSEFQNKEFIDMDTRYFGNGNIRQKFKQVGEDDLYKFYYDYDSQFEHGLWGAIRESSVLKCTSAGHQFHGIPDIDDVQELPDISHDMVMILTKHLSVINEVFPIPSERRDGERLC
ncbi:hypothetical protein SuUB85_16410 [Streptococcus uberis]|uniref:DUF5677 domain-containing protein n=1 Tax=Streptococcus uberis TaxID=1349 RepID=UPI00333EB9E6